MNWRDFFYETYTSPDIDAARSELAQAKDASQRHYDWMVEKYVGRERHIPEYVPEIREDDRLLGEISEAKWRLDQRKTEEILRNPQRYPFSSLVARVYLAGGESERETQDSRPRERSDDPEERQR
ncbi:MAG: hypothetical protein ACRDTZ_00075 [Pseudonocardiaceae bacterium]